MAEKSLKDLSNSVLKIAENSPKIQKDVEEIRKAICGSDGIVELLFSINQSVEKLTGKDVSLKDIGHKSFEKSTRSLTKSTDKISTTLNKILETMKKPKKGLDFSGLKSGDIKTKSPSGLESTISLIGQLRGIKLKDFIFAKTKIKHIVKIMSSSLDLTKKFKNKKEMDETISFISSSIDIVKKLSKISVLSKPAQWGVKAIENIYLGKKGKGGLLDIFKKLNKNEKSINGSKKASMKILATCGSMLLTSVSLSAIGVLSPLALLGALTTAGIITILTGSFKVLSKGSKSILKGAASIALLSASLLVFAVGFDKLRKSIKGLTLKEVGIMTASITGTGVAMAGLGLLSIPIALGSGAMLLMGASLGVFALALKPWKDLDTEPIMGNIKLAIGGLRDIFGLELGKNVEEKPVISRIGEGLIGFATSIFDFGKSFFTMGSLLLAGAALGLLKKGIEDWGDFDATKPAQNIKTAVSVLEDTFGLNQKEEKKGIVGKISNAAGSLFDFASGLFQMGSTFTKIGTLVMATASMDAIRLALTPWENYKGTDTAADNIKHAFDKLSDVFGLNQKEETTSIAGKLANVAKNLFETADSLSQMGPTFAKLSHIVLATASMDAIRLTLIPWNNYDGVKASENISTAMTNLGRVFNEKKSVLNIKDMKQFRKSTDEFNKGLKNLDKGLSKTTTMIDGVSNLRKISNSIEGSIKTINSLDISKATVVKDLFGSFSKIKNGRPFERFSKAVDKFVNACQDVIKSMDNLGETETTPVQSTDNSISTASTAQVSGGVNVNNVKQLAEALAEALGNMNIRIDPSMIDINLVAEGGVGKTVKLSILD